ncbi:MAG: hypothetical protein U9P63_02910 [Patescibacteria group bacterium]|nr:hypothetical protein [Patescibacteria group bacterium]
MKNYAKVGGRKEKPAYRTPSGFKARQSLRVKSIKAKEGYVNKS